MKKLLEDVWVVEGFKTAVNNQNGDVIAILDLVGEPSIAIAYGIISSMNWVGQSLRLARMRHGQRIDIELVASISKTRHRF